jgi:tetratricopeptide (TPR) repeat protein
VGEEADEFIDTRIRIMGLDPAIFSRGVRSEILLATEGSPLYIEDLLRLCAIGVRPHEAVQRWRMSSGDEARKYALAREFEKLSRGARLVLIAASLNPVPVSLIDLRLITNLTDDVLLAAVDELQRLYLVPKPRLIEQVERFDLNLNVAALVRTVTTNTPEYREIEGAIAQLSQDVVARGRQRQDVLQYLRQGVGLARAGEQDKAESVLQAGLTAHPNEADILGQLGWLYSRWRPRPRRADARVFFKRAAEMKCRQRDMYVHWADMEIKAFDHPAALAAIDAGLARRPDDPHMLRRDGYVRTKVAAELRAQGALSRAAEELDLANKSFETSLTSDFDADPESIRVRGTAYVSAIRNYELLQKPNLAVRLLRRWMAEDHDKAFYEERARFAAQHPEHEPDVRLEGVPKL